MAIMPMPEFDKPGTLPSIRQESQDQTVEERIVAFINSLPAPMREYILAEIEREETGTLPMPPLSGARPVLTPPPVR